MVERSDVDPHVWIPLVEECHRRTAVGAEASFTEAGGMIESELTLCDPESGSRKFHRHAKEAAVAPLADRAMAIVTLSWGFLGLVAHSATETAARDRNMFVGHVIDPPSAFPADIA
jgi:hypothetical protein